MPEFEDPPADPIGLLRAWLDLAWERGTREAHAFTLATVGGDGRPSSRTVLVSSIDARGIVFASHYTSRKGRDLANVPYGSGTLYWRETSRQVNLAGPVERLSAAESDALFADRPAEAKAVITASDQSAMLADEALLRARVEELVRMGSPLERPDDWGGYRLSVDRIEFWQQDHDRVHRRLQYVHDDDLWTWSRLQP
jgi:pyridoxamine 5'-phosphate oxidase